MTSPAAALISSLAPCSLTPQGGEATTLATELVGITWGIKNTLHHHSGNVYPTLVVIPGADRRVRLSAPFLDTFNLLGVGLTQLSAASFYLAAFADFNRESGSNHQMISLTSECVAGAEIVGWNVSQDGILYATVDIVFLSNDGQTDPITITEDQDLPSISGSPTLTTLGPVSFSGNIVSGVSNMGGQMGTTPAILKTDGDFFPRTAARLQADPVLTLTHSDPATLIQTLTADGISIAYNTIAYFRDFDDNGVVSNTGISITLAAGRIIPHGPDANQGEIATTGVDLLGISADGGANPLVIATNVSIPEG